MARTTYRPNRRGVRELANSSGFKAAIRGRTERVASNARGAGMSVETHYGIGGARNDRYTGYVAATGDGWARAEFGGGRGGLRGSLRP